MSESRLHVALRPRAEADIDDAIDHCLVEAGVHVAEAFGDGLAQSYTLIGANPGIGSPRYAEAAGIPGLRSWSMRPWPYLVFYLPGARSIDVIRLLHGSRDIPATLAEPES